MDWAVEYLRQFNYLVSRTPYSLKELTFHAIANLPNKVIAVIGLEKLEQLQQNLNIINNVKVNDNIIGLWWEDLPSFPERILNPSLW